MTKPSDFIFNSDYLALAETSRESFYVSVPSMGYTQTSDNYDDVTFWHTDLTTKEAEKSSIDEYYVKINNQYTFFGDTFSSLSVFPGPPGVFDDAHWFMEINRINKNTLRVSFVFVPEWYSQGQTTSPVTLNISVCSFKPPNVF